MSQVLRVRAAWHSHCVEGIDDIFSSPSAYGMVWYGMDAVCMYVWMVHVPCVCTLLLCFAKWGCSSANSNASWIVSMYVFAFVDGLWMSA